MGLIQAETRNIHEIIKYIAEKREDSLSIDANVELVIKPSRLKTGFIQGYHNGLFTKNKLVKGMIICLGNTDISRMSNDGMVNLDPLLKARNSQETYEAWIDMKEKYYDLERAKKIVNTRIVNCSNGMFLETICDVSEDSELVRMYGFTTWTFELFGILTNKNIAGFSKFIQELDGNIVGDPYEYRISKLRDILKKFVVEEETIDLLVYDMKHSKESIKFLETEIKAAYILMRFNESY